nr:uncharacterized protein LOC128670602 [Plodia interpunctella]
MHIAWNMLTEDESSEKINFRKLIGNPLRHYLLNDLLYTDGSEKYCKIGGCHRVHAAQRAGEPSSGRLMSLEQNVNSARPPPRSLMFVSRGCSEPRTASAMDHT